MARCKVVFVGAGSYVFGPAPIRDLLDQYRLDDLELVLVDPNPQMLDLMAGVARATAKKNGVNALIRTDTSAVAALDGADFVICAVAIDQMRRFATDRAIVDRHAPGHLVSEFGGVHGISMSLRQIAMIRALGALMLQKCPRAWLLNVANPLPRVCQAASEMGVKTVGFCSASLGAYGMLWQILHGQSIRYPFEPARTELDVSIAGLNHHTFVLGVRDRADEDLRPRLQQRLRDGATTGNRRAEELLLDLGYMLAVNDGHTHDFFSPLPGQKPLDHISHGNDAERAARLQLLRDIGAGAADPALCFEPPAWEFPGDFVATVAYGKAVDFHSLNLLNTGQLAALPPNVYVETAAVGLDGAVRPTPAVLPESVLPYCLRTAAVTDAIVRAATHRRRALLDVAIELDPTIIDKSAGRRAIEECLTAHADLIGTFD